jgi:hypothetical protein
MELTVGVPVVALAITILLNFGGLIWAIAKFKSETAAAAREFMGELKHLATALDRLSSVLDQTSARVQNHEVRLSVLENRGGRRQEDPQP